MYLTGHLWALNQHVGQVSWAQGSRALPNVTSL